MLRTLKSEIIPWSCHEGNIANGARINNLGFHLGAVAGPAELARQSVAVRAKHKTIPKYRCGSFNDLAHFGLYNY